MRIKVYLCLHKLYRMKKRLLLFIVLCLACVSLHASSPKYEMRAVWLTTNWGLDWPSRPVRRPADVVRQQRELVDILDRLQAMGINTVFFQARIRGEVFYASQYEPWAGVLSGGRNPGYDPLAFVVDECHRRAMECHAWLVTFPVGSNRQVKKQGRTSMVARHRSWCKPLAGEWFLDPGNPEVRSYLTDLVSEVVSKYDVDGIHLDYVRYPDDARRFPDADSFRKWGKGATSRTRWREQNITATVTAIYDEVKRLKPWVKVSSSPLGRYASLPGFPASWSCMEAVHQNPKYWLQAGKHDFIAPMMYFKEENYYPFLYDWAGACPAGSVASGIGVYRLDRANGNWSLDEIRRQIETTRQVGVGQAYFRYENLYRHTALSQWLTAWFYRYPALTPRCVGAPVRKVEAPASLQVEPLAGKSLLSWQPVDEAFTYIVYATDDSLQVDAGEQIAAVVPRTDREWILPATYRHYAVVARDRYGNESRPAVWSAPEIEIGKYEIKLYK